MIIDIFFSNPMSVWNKILWYVRQLICKKNIFIWAKRPPTFVKLLFALYIVNREKKIFQFVIFWTFLFGFRLHLTRRFQKGITLGVWSHISYFRWVVGVARGGLLSTRPQVLYLFGIVSSNAVWIQREKLQKLQTERFFFLDLLCKVRKLIWRT